MESLLSNLDSDSATGPDGISPRVLKACSSALAHPSLFYSPSHLLKVICHLLGNQQTSLPCTKKLQKQIPATTDQSAFSQSSARLWNPSSLQTLNPVLPLLQWLDFRSSILFQTRSLYPGYAASALPTMDGGPQCQTGNPSRIPGHITCF